MAQSSHFIEVYLEIGKKRTFAGAIDWPGWCRSGRDEDSALQSLFDYGPRYAQILRAAQIPFQTPTDVSAFTVLERLEGNTTTDFGVPDMAPSDDTRPMDEADLQRFQALLQAYWMAFDATVKATVGKELRKGPRGGGRNLEGIVQHVLGSDTGYLAQLGWKPKKHEGDGLDKELDRTRQEILPALTAAARGEIAVQGPRGGIRWTPRYFVRRVAWHVLDHIWEIEDRIV